MKANELMIGDWVAYRRDFPDKVDGISIGGHSVHLEHDGWVNIGDIQPVPLTPEILEKNGFIVKHPESTKRIYWKDRAGQIVGHKNRGLMYMEISGNPVKFGYFLPHFSGHIQFVHEFQHAIRLCRSEKEIEL